MPWFRPPCAATRLIAGQSSRTWSVAWSQCAAGSAGADAFASGADWAASLAGLTGARSGWTGSLGTSAPASSGGGSPTSAAAGDANESAAAFGLRPRRAGAAASSGAAGSGAGTAAAASGLGWAGFSACGPSAALLDQKWPDTVIFALSKITGTQCISPAARPFSVLAWATGMEVLASERSRCGPACIEAGLARSAAWAPATEHSSKVVPGPNEGVGSEPGRAGSAGGRRTRATAPPGRDRCRVPGARARRSQDWRSAGRTSSPAAPGGLPR